MQFGHRDLRAVFFNPGVRARFSSHLLVHCAGRKSLPDFVCQRISEDLLGYRAIALMHVDGNACVELALDPSDCVLDLAGRWFDPAEVVCCDCLDCFSFTPEIVVQLHGTVRPLEPGENVAFILLCGFECECVAIGDGQRHTRSGSVPCHDGTVVAK